MINADQIFARWQRHADALAASVRPISLPKLGLTKRKKRPRIGNQFACVTSWLAAW